MSEEIHYDRRGFVGTAVMAIAATRLVELPLRKPAPASRVRPIKGGYTEAGASNGPPVFLLCDIDGHADVAALASRGYRVIVPLAATSDVIALMATLKIEKALIGGFDEGARSAEVMAALWPQRLKCIAPVSGSEVVTLAATQRPLPPKEELAWWYRYYFRRDEVG